MPIICRICFSIYMFFHMTHIGSPPHAGGGHAQAATARSVRRESGKLPRTESRRRRRAAIHAANARRSRCPHLREAGPPLLPASGTALSYPDYDRRRVEDFAARTRWMPSAVARYSFASCPPLSPNTGVHTTHNARRIFEAIVWRYVRSARFIKVPPSL